LGRRTGLAVLLRFRGVRRGLGRLGGVGLGLRRRTGLAGRGRPAATRRRSGLVLRVRTLLVGVRHFCPSSSITSASTTSSSAAPVPAAPPSAPGAPAPGPGPPAWLSAAAWLYSAEPAFWETVINFSCADLIFSMSVPPSAARRSPRASLISSRMSDG